MMDLEAEREGNEGRRQWLAAAKRHASTFGQYDAMLEGAIKTIDRLLDALETAHTNGISVGRMSGDVLAEQRYRQEHKS